VDAPREAGVALMDHNTAVVLVALLVFLYFGFLCWLMSRD